MTRDTVATDTPAFSAISLIVIPMPSFLSCSIILPQNVAGFIFHFECFHYISLIFNGFSAIYVTGYIDTTITQFFCQAVLQKIDKNTSVVPTIVWVRCSKAIPLLQTAVMTPFVLCRFCQILLAHPALFWYFPHLYITPLSC